MSNAEGEMEFFIGKDDKCGSIVKTERENGDTIIVKTQILDTIVKQNNFKPDFIKIDIEGVEEFAIKGFLNTLNQFKPKLLIESHGLNCESEISKTLKKFNYKMWNLEENDFVFRDTGTFGTQNGNFSAMFIAE